MYDLQGTEALPDAAGDAVSFFFKTLSSLHLATLR